MANCMLVDGPNLSVLEKTLSTQPVIDSAHRNAIKLMMPRAEVELTSFFNSLISSIKATIKGNPKQILANRKPLSVRSIADAIGGPTLGIKADIR